MNKKVTVGRFGKAFGIKGWIKVYSFTEPLENILTYQPWFISQGADWQEIEVQDGKLHGQYLIIKIAGYDTPEIVKAFVNKEIFITHALLPQLAEQDYYWTDLENMSVVTAEGQALGRVSHLIATGANDVLVVKNPEGEEYLIPFISSVVVSVDKNQKIIVVDWDISW